MNILIFDDKMPNVMIKCPICGRTKIVRFRIEQKTFNCCGLRHLIKDNIIYQAKGTRKRKIVGKKMDLIEQFMAENDAKKKENEAVLAKFLAENGSKAKETGPKNEAV